MVKAVKSIKLSKKTKQVVANKQSNTSNEMALNHVIGKAIAKYRKQANLSQEQLAEALGIGYEAVSRMERGVVIPTVDRLIEIAEIVGCPVTELLSQTSPRPSDEVVYLHQLLSSLSSANKQWLMEQIEAWAQKLK
ncbi:helix-turn-helix domain-containing protein [Entomomonas moraniae]|nr:helix-turn-helix transcriptional regulator [Entomomonas moraniae]